MAGREYIRVGGEHLPIVDIVDTVAATTTTTTTTTKHREEENRTSQ